MRTPLPPVQIDADTWLVGNLNTPPGEEAGFTVQSMIILADEPVLVDTGEHADAENWLRDTSEVVDLEDVRWIFLTHEEPDHVGNVTKVLDMAPNATLVTTWFACERFAHTEPFPMNRVRWVRDGDTFDVGDRVLRAVKPPLFDGPTTRGLLDEKSRIYWAADAFACPTVGPVADARDMPDDEWSNGFHLLGPLISPWVEFASNERFGAVVDALERIDPAWIASCHGPPLRGSAIERALREARKIPGSPPMIEPDNEQLIASMSETGVL